MAFSFTILKPHDISTALQSAKKTARSFGVTFEGDAESGRFSGMGVEGNYEVGEEIAVTINKKPFLVTESFIKSKASAFFAGF
ncbi:hypothetical protein AGMMS50276_06930 [Synergistales bacterium]|nr:hypothetical protein AGMMS50276_06930 [Synergistales bacterium]